MDLRSLAYRPILEPSTYSTLELSIQQPCLPMIVPCDHRDAFQATAGAPISVGYTSTGPDSNTKRSLRPKKPCKAAGTRRQSASLPQLENAGSAPSRQDNSARNSCTPQDGSIPMIETISNQGSRALTFICQVWQNSQVLIFLE